MKNTSVKKSVEKPKNFVKQMRKNEAKILLLKKDTFTITASCFVREQLITAIVYLMEKVDTAQTDLQSCREEWHFSKQQLDSVQIVCDCQVYYFHYHHCRWTRNHSAAAVRTHHHRVRPALSFLVEFPSNSHVNLF